MNYRHIYMLIIEHAKSEQKLGLRPKNKHQRKNFPDKYFEFHHILPKSIFPLWIKRRSNIVPLTAREHFFCHQLLEKIYPNSNMFLALWYLANDGQHNFIIKNSYEYEKLKIQASLKLSSLNKGVSRNKGLYASFSEEKKKLIKEKRKQTQIANNTIQVGEKNGMYGKKWKDHPEWKHWDRSGKNNPNYGNHKLAGKNNPMYGKHIKDYMTEEAYNNWLKKNSASHIGLCCQKVLCIEDNLELKSYGEVLSIYGIPGPTLCRILKSGKDCRACPGKHFKKIEE